MTAFGRGFAQSSIGSCSIEIKSVNRKVFDVSFSLPPECNRFEVNIRQWLVKQISRGNLFVRVSCEFIDSSPLKIQPNILYAKQLQQAWGEIASSLQLGNQTVPVEWLTSQPELIKRVQDTENDDKYLDLIMKALRNAMDDLIVMKEAEGTSLQKDLLGREASLRSYIAKIHDSRHDAVVKYRDKLLQRLKSVLSNAKEEDKLKEADAIINVTHELDENDPAILKEIGIFAEKVDIAEEITRFNSHLDQLKKVLLGEVIQKDDMSKVRIGKKCEFLQQELLREINTIGAKNNDIQTAKNVIEVKLELDRIREQVLNIE